MEELIITPEVKEYDLYINGEWIKASSGKTENVISPIDEDIVGIVQMGDEHEANLALSAAEKAQKSWKKLPSIERANIMRKFAAEIRAHKPYLSKLLTREQGKLLSVAEMEVEVTATFIEYACDWARHIEGDIMPSQNANEQIWINKIPRGVIVAITAWNFPLALAGRKIGPALVAGNAIVVKPTQETPLATLELGYIAEKVGIPAGLINIVTGKGRVLGNALVASPITKMVTMTGSTPAGQQIFKTASEHLAHVQLELGGKAPSIVFADADIDLAVESTFHSRFDNCGQVCTCNERMYVHEDIYEEFMERFMEKVKAIKVGNPMEASTTMGPKVNASEIKNMEHLVAKSREEGATIAFGGGKPQGIGFEKGFWFEPTVITDVTQDMTVVHEEAFGPILPVLKFKTFDEVITNANDCEFGLAAMVFTKDINTIMKCNDELEFGEIYVNRGHGEQHQGFHNGYKLSGTGGEDGKYGFEQYMEKKTFYVKY
ncbi:aldehyde dehydrogenase [Flammeovirga kamogawensis]|uniref:Aldehyde dehydrogenase n=1 Tax=Flammeovirga kamogawensis TaxID=373891 RepID=A0ABX8H3D6_9BACT|nr:aldehyde dehydrogenase [Flammeovirga kamogawensis]MBB6460365.1 lactaldehyde dehydrogenase/glycolaldehyde dehydrogenase [Flammeovirga kamogawensis]QWG10174.1 aldehyde dehydrogenase [Flammeovirga kamogawensis]TRX64625.1 aldehyde dehydrogenase [Flammeovirga kamogawensis]